MESGRPHEKEACKRSHEDAPREAPRALSPRTDRRLGLRGATGWLGLCGATGWLGLRGATGWRVACEGNGAR